jgi:NADH-quinone oxidoreductase subunit E
MKQLLTKEDVETIIERNGKSQKSLIAILLEIQEASGKNYVSQEWADIVAKALNLSISTVYDVLTFYAMFSIKPRGKYVIELCKSAACHVNNSKHVVELFENALGIKIGETTEDGLFTLQYTSCIGACNVSPSMKIGEKVYGNLDENKIVDILDSYREGFIWESK